MTEILFVFSEPLGIQLEYGGSFVVLGSISGALRLVLYDHSHPSHAEHIQRE